MEKKGLMYVLVLAIAGIMSGQSVVAQDSTAMAARYGARMDSVVNSYEREKTADQQGKNSDNLSDLKAKKKEATAKAREAQRIETDAKNAEREAKVAYRQEKKAQRVREQADKQRKKATRARTISDQN